RRKPEQAQAPLCFLDESFDLGAAMDRVAVNDQEHGLLAPIDQPLEEFDEYVCRDIAFGAHEAQLSFRADGRDQIHLEPRAGALDDGSLPGRRPSRSAMVVRTDLSLVSKEDLRINGFGL